MKTLETNRLILRGFKESDVDDMFLYASDVRVGPKAGWEPHKSKEVTEEIIFSFIKNDDVWAMVDKATGKVIGSVGLHDRKNKNERVLGFVLSPDYWGKGLTKEAVEEILKYVFTETKIEKVHVEHFTNNNQSRRVIEKLGFKLTEVKPNCYKRYDGLMMDCKVYQMTKEIYEGVNK